MNKVDTFYILINYIWHMFEDEFIEKDEKSVCFICIKRNNPNKTELILYICLAMKLTLPIT